MNVKIVNILLWVAQLLVAAAFFFGFYAKIILPVEEASKMIPWVSEQPNLASLTGMVDLLGALGLILPTLLRIRPQLTTFAAYGGIFLVLTGLAFHLLRGETEVISLNIILTVLLTFIIWGRSRKV